MVYIKINSNEPIDLTTGNAALSVVSAGAAIRSGTEAAKTKSSHSAFTSAALMAASVPPVASHRGRSITKMNAQRAIEITEKVLNILHDRHFISSDEIHADSKTDTGKNFPELTGVTDRELRILIARGWLHAETPGGPNPNARISGGALYRILGPGPLWLHKEQTELTLTIAKQANNKSWLAIGIAVGSLFVSIIWFLFELLTKKA